MTDAPTPRTLAGRFAVLRYWALAATLSTFVLILLGAYVVKTGAGYSCPSWPSCTPGRYLPPFENPPYTSAQILSEWFHRVFAGVTSLITAGVVVVTFFRHRRQHDLTTLAVTAAGLLFAQILAGKLTVDLQNAAWTVVLHQGLAISFFGTLVAMLALGWRREPSPAGARGAAATPPTPEAPKEPRNALRTLGDYITLLKPRVLLLLLVSAVTSMLIAVGPNVAPGLVVATVVGGAMASGAGSAFNQWWERDLDAMMARTARRPVAAGRIPGPHVLAFSASLALGSFMVLYTFVNLLAALLAFAGAVFYVVVYTIWLKRTSASNIVIGGAAGSFPVLVGWAAATDQVQFPALLLGFVVFLWTPPHFWALALVYREDYARAKLPMLPVVRGAHHTKQQIFLYSIALFLCATLMWAVTDLSDAWLVVSMVLSTLFVYLAFETLRDDTNRSALRLFRFSILYLGLLFLSMAVDRILSVVHL